MSFWRNILRVLGFSNDVRVQIRAPQIDVVITGDPERVRGLLSVVQSELERQSRVLEPRAQVRAAAPSRPRRGKNESQVVRPTELDEMDSPYALPGMRAPGREDRPRPPRPVLAPFPSAGEASTLLPEDTPALGAIPPTTLDDGHTDPGERARHPSDAEGPEVEVTAVEVNPSGAIRAPSVILADPAADLDTREVWAKRAREELPRAMLHSEPTLSGDD